MTSRGSTIKRYMGSDGYPPATTAELMELAKQDRSGYNWMSDECARELGETIDPPVSGNSGNFR